MRRGCGRRQVALGAAGVAVPGVAVPGVLRALLSWAVEGGAHPVARQRVRGHEVRLRLACGPQNGGRSVLGCSARSARASERQQCRRVTEDPGAEDPPCRRLPRCAPLHPAHCAGPRGPGAGVKRIRPLSLVTVMPERVNPRA